MSETGQPGVGVAAEPFRAPTRLPEPLASIWPEGRDATTIIVGDDERVAEWVRQHLDDMLIENWGPNRALGIVIDGVLIAGVVYTLYTGSSIEASIASTTPRWCSRRNLAAIFAYPFWQLKCRRLGATTSAKNQPVRAFLCRLGFQEEGICRQLLPSGDAVIYGMLHEECRWLPRNPDNPGNPGHVQGQGQ